MSPDYTQHASFSIAAVLSQAFSACAGMWAVAYITHMPGVTAPKWVSLVLMLLVLFLFAQRLGRQSLLGWRGGLALGAVGWVLNLLVLGSMITGSIPGELAPSAPMWLLGSLLLLCMVGVAGAASGTARRSTPAGADSWLGQAAYAAAATTLLLLVAGGLVTSEDAGMAVPDWPNSYGFNMFLFPLSRMTEGIFYEHAHRLFGSLVGLNVLAMALLFQFSGVSAGLRRAAWTAFLLVCIQGILGGVRVTEDNTVLALLHGILGQLFFAFLVAIALLASPLYRSLCAVAVPLAARAETKLTRLTLGVLVVQLILGTVVRHFQSNHALWTHIGVGIFAAVLVTTLGTRAWGIYGMVADGKAIRRTGLGLVHAVGAQLILGFLAWVSGVLAAEPEKATAAQVWLATAHQAVGALVLAWSLRLTVMHARPAPLEASAEAA